MSTLATAAYALAAAATLLVMLFVVIVKPNGVSEGLIGGLGAIMLIAIGATSSAAALDRIEGMLPTVLFLGCCLILAGLCQREGLFGYLGSRIGALAHGSTKLLFVLIFVVAAVVTAALSLDTTVLLLTPVIIEVSLRARVDYRPNTYAACHLANTASLLLPVSNLTNLLAMNTVHLDVLGFARMMALPWLAAVIVEFAVLRTFFHSVLSNDLTGNAARSRTTQENNSIQQNGAAQPSAPKLAIVVVSLTLVGFLASGSMGLDPFLLAAAGCIPLIVVRTVRLRSNADSNRHSGLRQELTRVAKDANISFLVFVLSLAVVVSALSDNGIAQLLDPLFATTPSFAHLLLIAALSAIAANIFNNLPAAMLLIPLAAAHGTLFTLAVLIGVDIGPNLTYAGSLANILWRRILRGRGQRTELFTFSVVGLISVPLCIVGAVAALWFAR